MIEGKLNLASLMPGENNKGMQHWLDKFLKRKEQDNNNNPYVWCVKRQNSKKNQKQQSTINMCALLSGARKQFFETDSAWQPGTW